MRLYDFLESGNGYKVRLLLTQLGVPFERIELDILKGETRTAEFLRRNPNGRIPCLELEDGTHLWESNAIQFYLAEGNRLPAGGPARARAGAAVDVLRAVQPRAVHRGRALLAPRGRDRVEARPARREDGARLRGARGDGDAPARADVLRRRALLDRRHRALRLHARGARGRLRSRALSVGRRLARARSRAARHVPITKA